MKRITPQLIANLVLLMLDGTALLTTAATIGLTSALLSLALSKRSPLRSLPYLVMRTLRGLLANAYSVAARVLEQFRHGSRQMRVAG